MASLPRTILAVSFLTMVVIYGVWYSFSVFLVALIREFGWSRSLLSGVFSVFVILHGILGPAVGWLMDRIGPRRTVLAGAVLLGLGLLLTAEVRTWWHLYLAYAGVAAVGISLAGWVPLVVLIRGWFPDRFATAMGIASAGIGVGIFALVPLDQLVIEAWGWRWAYRMEAALVFTGIIPTTYWLIRDPPDREHAAGGAGPPPVEERHWTLAAALRSRRFWGVASAFFAGNVVTQMLLIHQVAYLVDHGVTPMVAAGVGGIAGLVSIGGKIGWGVFSDRFGREVTCTLAFGCTLASLGVLVLAGSSPTSLLPYAYAVLIGLGYGVLSPVFPAIASDLFGGRGFSTIYGALYTVICCGLALGAWMAGKLFDLTGSYALAFWVGALNAVLTPILVWFTAPRRPNPPPAG
jgi:MFS family permease